MQVFIPYKSPLKVAKCLDPKRLNKQIIECQQILNAINGVSNAWFNHPIVKMYSSKNDKEWLKIYMLCLKAYQEDNVHNAEGFDLLSYTYTPKWMTKELCDQHKKRLYTKAPDLYKNFEKFGITEENWYVIDGEIVKYINGQKIA